jgi:hypothetical protein
MCKPRQPKAIIDPSRKGPWWLEPQTVFSENAGKKKFLFTDWNCIV